MNETVNAILMNLSFFVMAAITLGGALGVVLVRKIFHSALFLVLSFMGVAGLYILLEAEFIAGVQVMVYVADIAVLILFAVMLTPHKLEAEHASAGNQQRWWALVAVVVFFVLLLLPLFMPFFTLSVSPLGLTPTQPVAWTLSPANPLADPITELGKALMGPYMLPFEVLGVILLAILVGAVFVGRDLDPAEE
ncbi:MAG: NADH-quinone oxidoreductase subunit J [Chloroflexi bacterium]|nr:NADH-quinone oxidoreductase subunit J [Chloroflexota bacterium]MBU1749245.1 NADH-quinone oxidoreductase subunit J [Chloroflexota bacterium]MBU1877671.1 NADH-quinone oxidoreductase subunit J [Chloroflexota bacterium]